MFVAGPDTNIVANHVTAVIATHPEKTMGKEAPHQVFAKRWAGMQGWRVVVALGVELARASRLEPGLEGSGKRALQQGGFGVAGFGEWDGLGLLFLWRGVQQDMVVPARMLVKTLW